MIPLTRRLRTCMYAGQAFHFSRPHLRSIARARRLSRAVLNNIRHNRIPAFVHNIANVPVAAGLLYPSFGLLISPVWARVALRLSLLSVVINAL